MQFIAVLTTFLAALHYAVALSGKVTFSYDYNPGLTTYSIACSDGVNGIRTKYGYKTLADIPTYPNVGGIPRISYNSTSCGTCWKLTYEGRSVTFLAIDRAAATFNLGKTAFQTLSNKSAEALPTFTATYVQVPITDCKLTA
ncbi:heat-stable 19 kDa antigen [Auricularia subglabra TFB-10046 SS5]|nr:heat-stable 19 kDa antigen [Auricularia subglabra TFB-10046 SS5]